MKRASCAKIIVGLAVTSAVFSGCAQSPEIADKIPHSALLIGTAEHGIDGERASSVREYTPTDKLLPVASSVDPAISAWAAYEMLRSTNRLPREAQAEATPNEVLFGRFESEAILVPPPLAWGFVFPGIPHAANGMAGVPIIRQNLLIVVDATSNEVILSISGVAA